MFVPTAQSERKFLALKFSLPTTFRFSAAVRIVVLLMCLSAISAMGQTAAGRAAAGSVNRPGNSMAHALVPREVLRGDARLVGRYNPDGKLRVVVGLVAPKLAEEEKLIADLQDRNSPNFHKYLTAEQWNARFAPAAEDEQAVVDWLVASGVTITQRYANRLIISAEAPSAIIEKTFGVQMNSYKMGESVEFSNDREAIVPAHLARIVQSIGGLNSLQRLHSSMQNDPVRRTADYLPGPVVVEGKTVRGDADPTALAPAAEASEAKARSGRRASAQFTGAHPEFTDNLLDPSDIYSIYGYDYQALNRLGHCCNPTNNPGGSSPITSIAVLTTGTYQNSDIVSFLQQFPYLSYQFTPKWVDGVAPCCDEETTMDLEWSLATSNSLTRSESTAHIFMYQGADSLLKTMTENLNIIVSEGNARVLSMSTGCGEVSCEDSDTLIAEHAIFDQMLGLGWTIVAASGDQGVTAGCVDQVEVNYPASDFDVLAVGGTTLQFYSNNTFDKEPAWGGDLAAGSCSANRGGSSGGCSDFYGVPGWQGAAPLCGTQRSVPDIALNAGFGQSVFFNGQWVAGGGTSIATPMVAGFMAQANSYLLALGNNCGPNNTSACAPLGLPQWAIYYFGDGHADGYNDPHYPFYDITAGCNANDVSEEYGLQSDCAKPGFDLVTGWGSFNALQLAWAINYYIEGSPAGGPKLAFKGPLAVDNISTPTWFNNDQTISWTLFDTGNDVHHATGIAGYTQTWDTPTADAVVEATQGSGNGFYNGPATPNQSAGSARLFSAGQGCHTLYLRAWDNTGMTFPSASYGLVCLDIVAPTVTAASQPAANSSNWNNSTVQVSLSSTDPGGAKASGVAGTYYWETASNCSPTALAACSVYNSTPLVFSTEGLHTYFYFTIDKAGNASTPALGVVHIDETAPVTTATLSGTQLQGTYTSIVKVTLSAADSGSGVQTTSYTVDGGPVQTYTGPFNVAGLINHTIRFASTDWAGNQEVTHVLSFTEAELSTTVLTATPNPALAGQPVVLTATVSALGAAANGLVIFKNGFTTLGTLALNNGVAKLSVSTLNYGENSLTASYEGGSGVLQSVSAVVNEDFQQATVTTLATSSDPTPIAKPVTFTATVKSIGTGRATIVTGGVEFYVGTTAVAFEPLVNGVATYTTATLPVGVNAVKATYAGNSLLAGSASALLNQNVVQGTTSVIVIASASSSQYLRTINFAANVKSAYGTPFGPVTFESDGVVIGTAVLSGGIATFATSALPVGTHSITAVYKTNVDYAGSSSGILTEVITPAETQVLLTSPLNPAKFGQPIALSISVSNPGGGLPSGAVTLVEGRVIVGSGNVVNGLGTVTLHGTTTFSLPAVGTHTIYAEFAGNASYLPGTSPALTQIVQPSPTATRVASSANPSAADLKITFTATIVAEYGSTPTTGSVTFMDGTTRLGVGAMSTNGTATISGVLTAGTHLITAVYEGSTDDATSTSPVLTQTVKPVLLR